LDELVKERQRLRSLGRRLVMTNGCFDLLHTGHIYFLQQARQLGDSLLIALNADISVKALKGPKRPLQSEQERAYALGALACVDHIVIFSTPDLVSEIVALQPDVYTKAGDYTLGKLHAGERGALQTGGASIQFLPFLPGFSTTSLIQRIIHAGGID
jgi:D-glycero-beta-D-manno-heptose 1-phosphate adenylyltransferase